MPIPATHDFRPCVYSMWGGGHTVPEQHTCTCVRVSTIKASSGLHQAISCNALRRREAATGAVSSFPGAVFSFPPLRALGLATGLAFVGLVGEPNTSRLSDSCGEGCVLAGENRFPAPGEGGMAVLGGSRAEMAALDLLVGDSAAPERDGERRLPGEVGVGGACGTGRLSISEAAPSGARATLAVAFLAFGAGLFGDFGDGSLCEQGGVGSWSFSSLSLSRVAAFLPLAVASVTEQEEAS